jgi:transcriptional regulator with XRE-family HTH domain
MQPDTPPFSTARSPSARSIVAVNVVRLRVGKAWSQERLGFETGLHRTFIAHVERKARNISLDNLEKVAIALGVETYELLLPQPPEVR